MAGMRQETAIDGFRLAYERTGSGPPVLVDGQPDAVRAYLQHFWSHWFGPGYEQAPGHFDHLVSVYRAPGAFAVAVVAAVR